MMSRQVTRLFQRILLPARPRSIPRRRCNSGGVEVALLDEPASSDAGHGVERQPVGGICLSNAASRTEAALMERGGEGLERRDTARSHCRKEFEAAQAEIEPAHDIGGGGDTGQERDPRGDRCFADSRR